MEKLPLILLGAGALLGVGGLTYYWYKNSQTKTAPLGRDPSEVIFLYLFQSVKTIRKFYKLGIELKEKNESNELKETIIKKS